jgi:hypothetical protein
VIDLVNGCFETCGALFIIPSILKLRREKQVRGVSWVHAAFFWAWGFWNLFYYTALGQYISLAGDVCIFTANTIWTAQLIYYSRGEK